MVAGMSGATCGSGAGVGPDEKDGRLMLPQAPRNTASVEAIPRLRIVRDLLELIMAFPRTKFRPHPPAAKRKSSVGAIKRQTP
jgi:hypothetical protein